jgi:hypothetical protein
VLQELAPAHRALTAYALRDDRGENSGEASPPKLRTQDPDLFLHREHGRTLTAGLIPYFKIGRAVRFRKSELDAALERMRMR